MRVTPSLRPNTSVSATPCSNSFREKMEANGGINHVLPDPLDSEYPEIAWGIEKSGENHKPLFIARPKVTDHAVKVEMLYW